MSSVQDVIECPQCGYAEADLLYYCREGSYVIMCRCCGYGESDKPDYDENGQPCGLKHEISKGFGALWYCPRGGGVFASHPLHTGRDMAEAESWLREALNSGTVEDTAYLTRWNDETKQVEMALGNFYVWPADSKPGHAPG